MNVLQVGSDRMCWLSLEIGVMIGLYIAIGFKLAIGMLKHTAKLTVKDRVGVVFILVLWLPLVLIGMLLKFKDDILDRR